MTHSESASPTSLFTVWGRCIAIGCTAILVSCGGGGGSSSASSNTPPVVTPPVVTPPAVTPPAVLPASATLANMCTTVAAEQKYVRSYLNENYLWYREIPAVDAALHSTVSSYFNALLVTTPDSNGLPKDQFSFTVSTADADSFSSGVNVGYGVEWARDSQGRIRVSRVHANSPASDAGMARGGELVSIIQRTPNSWYPNANGAFARFMYRNTLASAEREIRLDARTVTENAVPLISTVTTPAGKRAGYILFNDHSEGSQNRLITAVQDIQTQGLTELVLDMRYNGGGYIYVANALASMISGPSADNKIFEYLRYNDKRDAESRSSTFNFITSVLYSDGNFPAGFRLPRLNLRRVYMLTSGNTCSASESVINGLRGVDVEVVLIGAATCGKPFGFTRQDNCGRAYYPIEFQGTNNKGFGDYTKGFAPSCAANDDFEHALGQTSEGQLASALHHIDTSQCAPVQGLAHGQSASRKRAIGPLDLDAPRPVFGKLLHKRG
jgi:carboxyl-terminal processing protease